MRRTPDDRPARWLLAIVRLLSSLVVPGGLVLLAGVVFLQWAASPGILAPLVEVYPYAVFGAGVLLGWRFNRGRVVFALLVLAVTDQALQRFAAGEVPAVGRVVFNAVALLVPLTLAILGRMTERGLLTLRGLWPLALIVAEALAVAFLAQPEQASLAAWLERSFVPTERLAWTPLPQPALVVFVLAALLFAARFLRNRGALESGFLWALVAAFLALNAGRANPVATFYLGTGGLILVIALIEASHQMAYRDELTGLPARRALNEALLRLGNRYAIAMADIDHFKKFNDRHGHAAGDQLLKMIASKLGRVGGGGRAFRYGGEEFAVVFPDKSLEEVLPHLEALRKTVEASQFVLRTADRRRQKPEKPRKGRSTRKEVAVTISIGAAEPSEENQKSGEVIQAADKALYRAKQAGRNQVKT